jgi:ABC-type lipoprotein release transport system permease subunit
MSIVLGGLGAFALARFLSALLFGVGAWDPATLVAVAIVMSAAALAATAIPAWRAAHTDPAVALKGE